MRRLCLRVEPVAFPSRVDTASCSVASLGLRVSHHVPGPTLVLFLAGGGPAEQGEGHDESPAVRDSLRLAKMLEIEGTDAGAIQAGSDEGVHVAFRLFQILSADVSAVTPEACPVVNRLQAPALVIRNAEAKVTRVWGPGQAVTRRDLLDGMLEALGPGVTPQRLAREGYALLEQARSFVRLRRKIGDPDAQGRLERLRISIREREAELGARCFVDLDPWRIEGVDLVYVAPGTAVLGSERFPPRRSVEIPRPFLVGKYEVTNAQYAAFLADSGYDGETAHPALREPYLRTWVDGALPEGRARHPVCSVNWHHASAYCRWLGEKSGRRVRLPTEAEWAYAARGEKGRTGW